MKKLSVIAIAFFILAIAFTNPTEAQFKNRGVYLGPNLTLATTPTGFGGDIEFAVSPNFGIGGLIRYWGQSESWSGGSWSWSVIIPQVQGAYHFMPANEVDPYIGARLGYAIYSVSGTSYGSAKSDMFLTGTGGLRYFFSPKISVNGSVEFRLGGTDYFGSGLGLVAGIDFTL